MSLSFDSREVTALADAIGKAAQVAPAEVARDVAAGARRVQLDWRRHWSGYAHARALPAAVTFDTFHALRGPAAEVGPDKRRRQGALGNLFEYGSVKNAPIPGGAPAAAAEEPRLAKALEDAMVRALGLG